MFNNRFKQQYKSQLSKKKKEEGQTEISRYCLICTNLKRTGQKVAEI